MSGKANRGKKFEKLIDKTNLFYRENRLADIRKVPVPFRILGYSKGKVTGHLEVGEFVDYTGVSNGGVAYALEAKEIKGKSFPLSKLHEHQFEFLRSWSSYGARAGLLINFSELEEYYFLPFDLLKDCWENAKENKGVRGTQSIPIKYMRENAIELKVVSGILDYLIYINEYYE